MAQLPAIQATRKSGKECFEGWTVKIAFRIFGRGPFRIWSAIRNAASWRNISWLRRWGAVLKSARRGKAMSSCLLKGIKIEVKTSAYIQSWKQKAFSKISFGIAKTKFWDGLDYVGEKKRHADVYVFCVLKHKDQETINPLELAQWDFYPVATRKLNTSFENQETVSLGSLISHCKVTACPYSNLKDAIEKEYRA